MVKLSNRQFSIIEELAATNYVPLERAAQIHQRAFGSLLQRGYVAYKHGRGFYLTQDGRDARVEFLETDIYRKNPTLPLAKFVDSLVRDYKPRKRANVHVMPAKGAA